MNKSPFFVIEEFISPLMCEEVIDACDYTVPNKDKDGHWIKTTKTSDRGEQLVYPRLMSVFPELEQYYGIKYRGTERMSFEWFPEGSQGTFQCENSEFLRGKWLRTKNRDLSGILFLSDYQDQAPIDPEFEMYGGKLEFPQHHFGFNPIRGTLVIFPSDPHFINVTARIQAGDLHQVRFHIAAQTPYLYDPGKFPGNYTTWFAPMLGN